ncbi:MAG: nuclear transport factor 2 family protein [Hymenobacteraceae bacterium]|nr:nuclear transport factor 2 family protein [Hymenobacteraceae bacterium]
MKRNTITALLTLMLCFPFVSYAYPGSPKAEKELSAFITAYVKATNSHDFSQVAPLLFPEAVYWFNRDESQGIAAIRENFERTWRYLPDEVYGIESITWLSIEKNSATCIYTYTYQGTHDGKPVKGSGRGTSILVKQNGKWQIAHEHLSIPQ